MRLTYMKLCHSKAVELEKVESKVRRSFMYEAERTDTVAAKPHPLTIPFSNSPSISTCVR